MDFNNKVFWITGASSGIGKALTEKVYSVCNARIIISARNKKALEDIKKNLDGQKEGRIFILPLDLEDHHSLEKKAETARGKWGSIDYLINNAGLSQRSLVKDTDFNVIRKIIDINLLGTIELTRRVLPFMMENASGHITVISSVAGKFATPLRSAYSAGKMGLQGFFDALRLEVHPYNIGVTMVFPGFIRTDISINSLTGDGEKYGIMDSGQAHGMSADVCADKILAAVRKKTAEKYIAVSPKIRLALFLKKFFPGLLEKILRKSKPT